jgi:hypothetical protein
MIDRDEALQLVALTAFLLGGAALLWALLLRLLRRYILWLTPPELLRLRDRFPPEPMSSWERGLSGCYGQLRVTNLQGWRSWVSSRWAVMSKLTPTGRGVAVRLPCWDFPRHLDLFVRWNCLSSRTEERGWITKRAILRIADTDASLVLSTHDWNREFYPHLAEWQRRQAASPPESAQPTAP